MNTAHVEGEPEYVFQARLLGTATRGLRRLRAGCGGTTWAGQREAGDGR